MRPLNILIAIPYLDKPVCEYIKSLGSNCTLLLDSGAFTYWKKGQEVPLSQYVDFISKLEIKPWRYFTLDVVGDAKRTKENFAQLIKEGLKPVPIFTRGESISELEYYYENSNLVGIGGLVGTMGNKGFVKGMMTAIGKRKSHWLGFINQNFVSHYKPFSCDSSSWSAPLRFGGKLPIYLGGGQWRNVSKQSFSRRPEKWVYDAITYMGEDPRAMAFEREWHNSGSGKNVLERLLYKSWVRYSMEAEEALGTKVFLAVASAAKRYTMSLMEAHKFWEDHPSYSVGSGTPESRKASLRS